MHPNGLLVASAQSSSQIITSSIQHQAQVQVIVSIFLEPSVALSPCDIDMTGWILPQAVYNVPSSKDARPPKRVPTLLR